jgi:two-component system, LuxR family, response regulator FixJ
MKLFDQAAKLVGSSRAGDGRTKPIFVVDDDVSVRDSLSVLLETLGFQVFTHGSGAQLLADDRRRNAGCLIVDHHMPGMDGLEMLAALRGEGINASAILITGRLDQTVAERAASIGVKQILEKPFSATRLIELVRSSLEKNQ